MGTDGRTDGCRERTTAGTAAQVTTAIGVVQPGDGDALPGNGQAAEEREMSARGGGGSYARRRPAGGR